MSLQASPDEATSSELAPAPQTDVPEPIEEDPNRWCVDGQYKVYRDTKMLNDKRRVLTGSIHTVIDVQ